ncbi:FdrA family protein [Actinomadura xylanilytica]|uniref:FdrA family protein n=1 Tax=Actinomadura xylanilytica TaxID=887459 RepID=UPI00255B1039|nr:FdrA family protein [Actinomadura xylanilytica]MDL4771085.1 FdrA family protein [Actinomadura xylanilytica]
MRVSRSIVGRDGVTEAMAAMGTGLNLEVLARMGFAVPGGTGPGDLVVAIRAGAEEALDGARDALDGLLRGREPAADGAGLFGAPPPARTTASAASRTDAGIALLSVPGPHVVPEAMDALNAGLNVMIFSDNVPVGQEVALKEEAARRGLIVMGPDCGTAVVGGAGLGFANAVRPGPVGMVAASGTGAQQLMCLLDAAGVGVSHVLGVGGRDLSTEVSGRSSLAALAALDADPATELIMLVSKPPAPRTADLIREAARRLDTPVVFALPAPGEDDLTRAAERALAALGRPVPEWPRWLASGRDGAGRGGRGGESGRALRGLFAGGTLRAEAEAVARDLLGWDLEAGGHRLVDYGDDAYTRGRAHPMIDPTLRLEALADQAADPGCGVLLLDVVLGFGADPDPAGALAPVLAAALRDRGDLAAVVSLCGTPADPQDRDRQAAALCDAGADVFASNAEAARHAVRAVAGAEGEA